jgi:hypothetical protein
MSLDVVGVNAVKYLILSAVLFLAACSTHEVIEKTPIVEVRTVQVPRPAPIVPAVDQLNLRPVNWIIITPDNIEEKFSQIRRGELVLFAVTAESYENVALNLSDIRALIEQQHRIIAIYKSQF